ncbi:MAG: hypothetical protein ABDH21_01240 [bacterium]
MGLSERWEVFSHLKDQKNTGYVDLLSDKPKPLKFYYLPILESLIELGGRAEVEEILSRVFVKVKKDLSEKDLGKVGKGEMRWRNFARWARKKWYKRVYFLQTLPEEYGK